MSEKRNTDLISRIVGDIASHAAFAPYTDEIPDDLTAAYDIQDQVVEQLVASGVRAAPCGHKLALNSQQLMAHFGVSDPCAGRLFSDQKWPSGTQLLARDYRSLRIEPEIMAVMADDLAPRPGGQTRASAEAAIAQYLPAFELVDARDLEIPQARLASVVAQNITTAGVVFGGPGLTPDELDVATLPVTLTFDGQIKGQTSGSAPQHPGDAVAWLANFLETRGTMLKAGDIVICGTHLPPPPIGDAGHVHLDMGPLGVVEFSIV